MEILNAKNTFSCTSISPGQPPLIQDHSLKAGCWTQPKRNQEPTTSHHLTCWMLTLEQHIHRSLALSSFIGSINATSLFMLIIICKARDVELNASPLAKVGSNTSNHPAHIWASSSADSYSAFSAFFGLGAVMPTYIVLLRKTSSLWSFSMS